MNNKYDISKTEIEKLLSDEPAIQPDMLDINQTEAALINFAKANSIVPPPALRNSILGKINTLEAQKKEHRPLDASNLPMLDSSANWLEWQSLVEGIEPPANFDNIYLHPLESNDRRELFVAWVKEMVDEEVHHDILESFILLEGTCECHITNEKGETRIVRMTQGDYISMQLGETHDVVITSLQPAKAILEWRKLAA